MKKGKVLGKSQIILAVMVVALGAAVWFNMRYSQNSGTKYLGEAQYVDNSGGEAVETSGTVADYFATAREERAKNREEAQSSITETIKTAGAGSEAMSKASEMAATIASRQQIETNIETLLKAKGFSDALAVIGDSDINIIVRGDSLSLEQTIQIQDIAAAQSGFTLDKIKILTVK